MEIDKLTQQPNTPSADWRAMAPYWAQVTAIVNGRSAMIEAGEEYLPKFPHESNSDYQFRLKTAKFTNIYRDILEGLAQKPFAHELTISEASPIQLRELAEDIDGRGNHLHVFAANTFFAGINKAIDWILVDYTKGPISRTVQEQNESGSRPYWVHIPAEAVIGITSEVILGREQLTEVRILESPGRVRTFERLDDKVTYKIEVESGEGLWAIEDAGTLTINEIPIVPFVTGRRKGKKWQYNPSMKDAADLQIEMYQQETNLKHIKTMTCFPMLAGNGVMPDMDGDTPRSVPVGPKAVLYAPPNADGNHGTWEWIGTDAATLKFLAADVQATTKELREIGRQPLTSQSGNLTVITTAFAAQKGNSAVQAWALQLKDSLENAMRLTSLWLGISDTAEVNVFTDFGIDDMDDQAPKYLLEIRKNNDISAQTLREEYKRRGILGPEFDEQREVSERLFAELPGGENEI